MFETEQKYWYGVVYRYITDLEDWRYPDDATQALLNGTANQDYIDPNIEWPVMRWRELSKLIEMEKKDE